MRTSSVTNSIWVRGRDSSSDVLAHAAKAADAPSMLAAQAHAALSPSARHRSTPCTFARFRTRIC
eukprot:6212518-Pleurochrysis_carterae.AAC.19